MLGVRSGMEVRPNENLYTIADLSTVWVLSDVYEVELPWVSVGQRGTVELSYLPGVRFSGAVTFVSPFLDPKTRTAQVRIELANPDGRLKPEMFGNTTIETDPRADVLTVPSEAVLRSGRRNVVMLDLGEGRFAPREVELGIDSGDGWTEVLEGLDEGDAVVVSSQFLLDSESRLQEVVRKLLGQPAPGGPVAEPEAPPPAMPSEHQPGEEG
jgi:RND family efflux transporter MFP subunit